MRIPPTVVACVLLLLVGCDEASPDATSTSIAAPGDPNGTTTTSTTTTPPPTTTTTIPHPDLDTVEGAILALIPDGWTRPSVARAPFTISVCGRSIRIVDADSTDESPDRPREGISINTTAPNGETVNLLIYEQFEETAWDAIEAALPICGPTTQTNPVDGWTLSTASDAGFDTIAGLIGIRVSSDSDRVYTDNRVTRYSTGRVFLAIANGLLARVSISHASTDPGDLAGIDPLLFQATEMVRLATSG